MRIIILIIAGLLLASPFYLDSLNSKTKWITSKRLDFLEQRVSALEEAMKGGKR